MKAGGERIETKISVQLRLDACHWSVSGQWARRMGRGRRRRANPFLAASQRRSAGRSAGAPLAASSAVPPALFTELYRVLPSFTGLDRCAPALAGSYWVFTDLYRVLPGFYRLERIGQGCIELEWVLLGFSLLVGFDFKTGLGFNGLRRVLRAVFWLGRCGRPPVGGWWNLVTLGRSRFSLIFLFGKGLGVGESFAPFVVRTCRIRAIGQKKEKQIEKKGAICLCHSLGKRNIWLLLLFWHHHEPLRIIRPAVQARLAHRFVCVSLLFVSFIWSLYASFVSVTRVSLILT